MSFNGWKEERLVEICDLISRGVTPSYTEDKEEGVIVINQKCIRDNSINLDLARLTNPNKKKIADNKYLKLYDILVNSTGVGTLGRVAQVKRLDEKMTVDSHVTIVRAKDCVNPEFLGYNLFMNQRYIEYLGEGSTGQTELSRIRLGEALKVKLPPIEEQKAIANILSNLDNKIEVNNKINQKLEKMAQAIFKQWFIDFDFPNKEGKPYKSSGGEMVESELGVIPISFKEVNLTDVVEIKYGKNLPKNKLEESGYPVFGGNGIIGYYKEYMYEQKQVLVSCRGAASGKVLVSDKMSYITNNSLILEITNDITFEYLKQYCINYPFYNYATGSAQPQITINNISNVKLYIPSDDIMNKFSNILKSLDNQVDKNRKENEKLAKLRDTLLPKLMSGEIRVPINN